MGSHGRRVRVNIERLVTSQLECCAPTGTYDEYEYGGTPDKGRGSACKRRSGQPELGDIRTHRRVGQTGHPLSKKAREGERDRIALLPQWETSLLHQTAKRASRPSE
jgi:hypothetical protein